MGELGTGEGGTGGERWPEEPQQYKMDLAQVQKVDLGMLCLHEI